MVSYWYIIALRLSVYQLFVPVDIKYLKGKECKMNQIVLPLTSMWL